MADPIDIVRPARAPLPLAIVTVLWVAGILAITLVDAHPLVVGLLLLFTLPAIYDMGRGRVSRLHLDDRTIRWSNGVAEGEIALTRIAEVKLHTGLDFSQRARIILKSGEKTRIPPDCLPHGRRLDAALDARGIPQTRSLFAL